MSRLLVMLAVLSLAPSAAWSQTPPSDGTRTIVEGYFTKLTAGQYDAAYDTLFVGSMIAQKPAEAEAVTQQTKALLPLYGKLDGWEFIREDRLSASYVEQYYLLKSEKMPLFFKFQLYRRGDGWRAAGFFFNDTASKVPGLLP